MLSDDNPVLSSPQPPEFGHPLHPPPQAVPARAALRGSSGSQDNGYGSELERRAVTPNPPPPSVGSAQGQQHHQEQPARQQQVQQSPFSLNAPKTSLSPFSEYHSGYSDADLESSPCPSPSPFGPSHKHLHRRQQSFPNLFPLTLRSRSQSRTPSPTRKPQHQRYPSEQMPYTGEGRVRQRAEGPRSGLAGWLSGTAAGSALGMTLNSNNSIDARTNANSNTSNTPTAGGKMTTQFSETSDVVTPTRAPHRGVTATTTNTAEPQPPTPKPATPANNGGTMTSRFMSAFTSRFTTPTTPTTSVSNMDAAANDELLNLNIETALFPPTSPSAGTDRDSFSPAAFKNFQMNAIGLLTKYQTAYKTQAITVHDLQQERSAQKDELEEAETRAKHLKFQLEGMARELAEQEKKMRALSEELQLERERNKAPSVVLSEDLGVDTLRRRKRRSGESWSGEDDEEEEEEVESAESESVFSRCRSPTSTVGTGVSGNNSQGVTMPETPVQGQFSQSRLGTPMTGGGSLSTPRQQKPAAAMNAFQKIFKGIAGDGGGLEGGCRNCKGQDASVAWDTVGLLRDENRQLKGRVGELEGVVEGALDLVNGIGM
ncbi:hypothetical protein B0T21DRAFT_412954 [Apiosordaria backusii]|uniref:Uncharacterized protein n=1 Tax=Apiosordaria backusii TaxID=314023 RepID=A0AA40EEY3_9PEZI|nr:hypothetical protein B0T21DRAFT_412954 [Apiosordaria backusii]